MTYRTNQQGQANKERKKRSMFSNMRKSTMLALLIAASLFLSSVFVLAGRYEIGEAAVEVQSKKKMLQLRGSATLPQQAFDENHVISSNTNHLIIVAGHSVTISDHLGDAEEDEADWFLLDYQKGKGLPQAILAHIRAGIQEAAKDLNSILLFSGGETRAGTGPVNEGTSYFHVADVQNLWGDDETQGLVAGGTVRSRTSTEEFAMDSFQNLLFSICRFKEITSSYPTKITLVSFTFKRNRFENLHINAIRYPKEQFNYVGVDPPETVGFNLQEATLGEQENAVRPFDADPYGCHSQVLLNKRKERNPFRRTPPYELSCPELKGLLAWCGPDLYPVEHLPWFQGS